MKKTICTLLCVFAITGIFAVDLNNTQARVRDYGATLPNAYLFEGFQWSYDPAKDTREGLTKLVADEYDLIKNGPRNYTNVYGQTLALTKATDKGPYVAIGHSQGGLRALAYATYLKQHDPVGFQKLKGVITISGIDRGIKLLDDGLPATKARILRKTNVVLGGIEAMYVKDLITYLQYLIGKPKTQEAAAKVVINELLPNDFKFLNMIIDNPDPETVPQIRDMIPASEFVKNNIIASKATTYKKQIGVTTVPILLCRYPLGSSIQYIQIPTYAYYTMYHDETKFDADLPVGYIVGLDNNTMKLGGPEKQREINLKIHEMLRNLVQARAYHLSVRYDIRMLVSFRYENNAFDAFEFLINLDAELNDLKRSTENDGFVAKESQYIPKTAYASTDAGIHEYNIHTKVLNGDDLGKGRTELTEYNHTNIIDDKSKKTWDAVRKMMNDI
jgi:pimeloyl-ACP methyl ester carboxylesterase